MVRTVGTAPNRAAPTMTFVPAASTDPMQLLADLDAGVARVADALYQFDAAPEFTLARDPSKLSGQSAVLANEASTRAAACWQTYPVLKEAVEQAERAADQRDWAELERLLGRQGVTLPDGSKTSPAALLATLEADVGRARAAAEKLAEAWRDVLPRLDRAGSSLAATVAKAADLGLDEPELTKAKGLLERLSALAAADPLTVDPGPAEAAVEQARTRVEQLAHRRGTLVADLDAARAELDGLARLIEQGRQAATATKERIADADGLVEPLDQKEIDGTGPSGTSGLRPWLARIESEAGAGSWVTAVNGLVAWQKAAADLRARAEAVLAANRAPLARRNQLRGLLESYRVKAAAVGVGEDPDLTARYRVARDALYVRPVQLVTAERLVQEYVQAVNRPAESRRDPS